MAFPARRAADLEVAPVEEKPKKKRGRPSKKSPVVVTKVSNGSSYKVSVDMVKRYNALTA